ncbi:MAG: helix-turn-helix transcriptional regulator [Thermomicrobiales bacterium]
MAIQTSRPVGLMLREWRERRKLSQLELALEADVSARHVSFVETGKSRPSREMLVHLMERLDIPSRERNRLLLAAGFAPLYPERTLDDPALQAARAAIERVLTLQEPFPALAVYREWSLVAANRAVGVLTSGIAPKLLRPPVNVLKLSLHPDGLATRILNLGEWKAHIFDRLRRQIDHTGDPRVAALLAELTEMPVGDQEKQTSAEERDESIAGVAIPLRLRSEQGPLSFLTTTMIFGTPLDITLSELAIESFFPADARTQVVLERLGERYRDSTLEGVQP